jgi:hypothetical protein
MLTYKLNSFPIEQVDDLESLEWRLGQFFAPRTFPMRFVATSRRFLMDAPIRALQRDQQDLRRLARAAGPLIAAIDAYLAGGDDDPRAVIAGLDDEGRALLDGIFAVAPPLHALLFGAPAGAAVTQYLPEDAGWTEIARALSLILWSLPWRSDLIEYYGKLQERHLRTTDHYLLAWPPAEVQASALQAQLKHAFGRDVELIDSMPPVIGCPYETRDTLLEPTEPGHPYLAVLHSYEIRGEWDAATLHPLLDVGFEVSVVVDVQTLPRNAARRKMELAYNAARLVARDNQVIDTRAEQVFADSQRVLHESTQQGFHLVTIAVLVSGATRAALEQHVDEITDRLGSTLRLTRAAGAQDQLIKLWSPVPTKRIDAPLKPWNMLSHGVGCCAGLIAYHGATRTDGILWGIDMIRRAPLFFDLSKGKQAAHCSIVGMTGYGKTWFINTVTLRAALAGWKVIALDIAENCLRIERAAGVACRSNLMGVHQGLNILDVVYPPNPEGDGDWRALQVEHVIDQLAMLLGDATTTPEGELVMLPRRFSVPEQGILSQVLSTIYAEVDPQAPLDEMPLLRDLIAGLNAFRDSQYPHLKTQYELAEMLHLFLAGSRGDTFNRHTTVDWDFGSPINYFDFKENRVPKNLRGFFMGQVIGAIYRYMLDPRRDRTQPTLLIVDEAGIVGQIQSVSRMLAELAKRARKDMVAVMPADQNPSLYRNNPWFKIVFELSPMQVMFRLKEGPAQEMAEMVHELTPEHVDFLTQADKGEVVMVVRNDVYVARIETTPRESAAFAGS